VNNREAAGLQQLLGHAAALAAVAVQQYRRLPVQLLECLLDKWQRYIDRAGQGTTLVFHWIAYIDQLCTPRHQVTGIGS
jgi:hypothetical protein